MSEVSGQYERSARQHEIEEAIAGLSEIWESGSMDMPQWAAHELTFSQMRLLFLLGKNGPSPVSHVAEWLGVGMPTASGAIDRLERHGLVARRHRRDDRRVVECFLTEDGRHLLDQISGMRLEGLTRFFDVLNDQELGEMARLVTIVSERVKAQLAEGTNSTTTTEVTGNANR